MKFISFIFFDMDKYWGFIFFTSFLLWGCASTGSLGGGPKDKQPPKIIEPESSANFQTNFNERSFELTFDEFVVLRDPIKQIVVSPPLTYLPVVKNRGKKVIFSFNEKEVIKDSTTYTVNFGESIQDLHENNKLDNYRFVFSSGDIIDSLAVQGEVKDVLTGKPVENITVMLYDNLTDSAFVKEKPFYFARTNKEGVFSIQNIKKDTFRIFAIKDENVSYTFNEGVEMMGYNDTLIVFSDTSTVFLSNINLSKPLGGLRVFDSESKSKGLIKIKFNRPLDSLPYFHFTNDSLETYSYFNSDSLLIWYAPDQVRADSFIIDLGFDTIILKIPSDSTFSRRLNLSSLIRGSIIGNYDTLKIRLTNPGYIPFENAFGLIDTSGNRLKIPYQTIDQITYTFDASQIAPGNYTFRIDSAAFIDIFENVSDSFVYKITRPVQEKLSGLVAKISKLDSLSRYVVELQEGSNPVNKTIVVGQENITLSYSGLRPGAYKIVITQDLNGNGLWDAVDFWHKRQAETTKTFTVENLRENWTVETEISFQE